MTGRPSNGPPEIDSGLPGDGAAAAPAALLAGGDWSRRLISARRRGGPASGLPKLSGAEVSMGSACGDAACT